MRLIAQDVQDIALRECNQVPLSSGNLISNQLLTRKYPGSDNKREAAVCLPLCYARVRFDHADR